MVWAMGSICLTSLHMLCWDFTVWLQTEISRQVASSTKQHLLCLCPLLQLWYSTIALMLSVMNPDEFHTKWYPLPIWATVRKWRQITAVDFRAPHLISWLSTLARFRCTDSWTDDANVLFHYREVIQSGIFAHRAQEKCEITRTTCPWSLPRLLSR